MLNPESVMNLFQYLFRTGVMQDARMTVFTNLSNSS